MQTLFVGSRLEEESLCPQQLKRRTMRERRASGGREEVCKRAGVSRRCVGEVCEDRVDG